MKTAKNIILIVLTFFSFTNAFSQDECSLATTITPGTTCTYTTFDMPGTLTKSTNALSGCTATSVLDDAWAKFVATGTASTVKYQNTSRDAAIWIYRGTCASLVYVGCVDNIAGQGVEEITFASTIGTTYYIRVGRVSGNSTSNMTGSICVVTGNLLENDDPCGATLLSANASFSYSTNVMATTTAGVTAPGCGNYLGTDIWFKTVVPSTGAIAINTDTGSLADMAMAVYSGACNSLTLLSCYDDGGGSNGLMPYVNLGCLTPGDTLRLRFWEYGSNATGNFRIKIGHPGVVNSLTWVGSVSNSWTNTNNWAGCAIPDSSKDVVISSSATVQPSIPASATINCRNLTIQSGATLTLGTNCILNISGNYTNNGALVMPSSSTVQFKNAAVQTIDGNMVGVNQFGNFSIVKTGGSLTFLQDADIIGNWINSAGSTSVNMNGKKIRLKGNFTNPSSSVIAPVNSTLEFNGTTNQTYHEGGAALDLQNIIINKATGTFTLQTNMNIATTGNLTLTSGIVLTDVYTLNIKNNSTTAIIGGGASSYIQGNLNRAVDGTTATYEFPVGKTGKGYEKLNINFTNTTNVTELMTRFDTWPGTISNGPVSNDCGGVNYGLLPLFNSGYWTITSNPAVATGNYNMTIASIGQSNASVNAGTTIVKSTDNGTTWGLDGNCVIGSNATLTARTLMSGFGVMSIGQISSPLPIELLSFTGTIHEKNNILEWMTATEKNNDFFTVQRSFDGITFESIGTVKGAGNSNVPVSYRLTDDHPVNGVTYYQLMQTDFDGTSSKSGIIALNRKSASCVVSAYPNPSNGPCDLTIETADKGYYTVYINDMAGKEMYRQFIQVNQDVFKHTFNMSEYKCGMYNCILENQITKEKVNVRLIKQ